MSNSIPGTQYLILALILQDMFIIWYMDYLYSSLIGCYRPQYLYKNGSIIIKNVLSCYNEHYKISMMKKLTNTLSQ